MHEGAPIAIWNMSYTAIEGDDSLDRLAANLIHETFHAFQRLQGETRFAHDLELLLYPCNSPLAGWARREAALLTRAVLDENRERTMKALTALAAIRREKDRLTGGATLDEYRAETTEGLAEHAGYLGLCQLNPPLADKQLHRYKEQLCQADTLLDVRRRAYFTGTLLAIAAGRAGLSVVHDLSEEKTFWDWLAIAPGHLDPLNDRELSLASSLVALEKTRQTALLDSFRSRFPRRQPVDTFIVGYDPMNLTRVGDYLLSTHILMTGNGGEKQTYTGDRLFLMKTGDVRQVEAIFTESP
jgi:hypothetical protein